MEEIALVLQEEEIFDHIVLIDLYDSLKGKNLLMHPNLLSPIKTTAFGKKALDQYVLLQLLHHQNAIIRRTNDKDLELHFIGHSLGGLVIRSVLQNLLLPSGFNRDDHFYIGRGRVDTVITLGTAHQGSYLGAMLTPLETPLQALFGINKAFLSLMGKIIEKEAIEVGSLAFIQFSKTSQFIQELNVTFDALPESIKWISIAGQVKESLSSMTPNLLRKMLGSAPNDGIIEVSATFLPNFRQTHIIVNDCSHGDLVKWKTTHGGREVWRALRPLLVLHDWREI